MEQLFSGSYKACNPAQTKVVVALSGGLDSMVLASLLLQQNADCIFAHCNFGLRDDESDGDEQFLRQWAAQQQATLFVQQFPTRAILETNGGNLQQTARELRYAWFETLAREQGATHIVTAHHADDSAETLLINFFKGTGINGLHGILPVQGKIIRPLLPFTREDILQYAKENEISWREDSSNAKTNYTRNKVRHQLMPLLEDIFPEVRTNLQHNIERFRGAGEIYNEAVAARCGKLIEKRKEDFYIPLLKLRKEKALRTLLFELIRPFGFLPAQLDQAMQLLEAATGKYISSATHRIIRNREFLIVTALRVEASTFISFDEEQWQQEVIAAPGFQLKRKLRGYHPATDDLKTNADTLLLDNARLDFPVVLRPWKAGDYFYPLGLNKKKKIARFLIDQKVPLHEKEQVWVLESNKKIAWVIGFRMDHRFAVTNATKELLELRFIKSSKD